MFKKQFFALALTGCAAFTTAQAADEFLDDRFYVSPFGTYLHGGGDRNGFDGWGGGLAIGKIINEYFNVEVRGFWQEYKGRPGPAGNFSRYNADLTGGTIDLQYYFFRDAFSPYAVVGIGGMNTSARWPVNNPANPAFAQNFGTPSFIFETGVGATYELSDNFLLRADVRYRLDTLAGSLQASPTVISAFNNRGMHTRNDVFNDLLVNVGFVIPFGDKPAPAVVAAPVSDCSTKDSDRDGVNDCDDKCPNTAKGIKVDEFGCPIRIELKGVNFKYDSPELTPAATAILDKVAVDLLAYPVKKNIEVRGHASSEGTNAYNLRLSQKRSESVAAYLKRKGVTNKLIAKGYGEEYPIADNNTEAGREKNRRVELVWTGE
ncbi:MAG: OmpA family protein [Candidatus Methylumidiphilus sp.]